MAAYLGPPGGPQPFTNQAQYTPLLSHEQPAHNANNYYDPYSTSYSQPDFSKPPGNRYEPSTSPPQAYHSLPTATPQDSNTMEMQPLHKPNEVAPLPAPSVKQELLFATGVDRLIALAKFRKEPSSTQTIENRRRQVPGQRFPAMTWALTIGRK